MTQIVTLAHRVSRIHARYAKIHGAVQGFSWRALLSANRSEEYARHAQDLSAVIQDLADVQAFLIAGAGLPSPHTTLEADVITTLRKYVAALSDTVGRLSHICRCLHADGVGEKAYDEVTARRDRATYDVSVQRYKRLGERLNHLFVRL